MTELAIRDKQEIVRLDTEQIKFLAHTEFVPEQIRGNLPAIFATIATGREIGIGDMASLRHIHIIDGKPGYSAEIMAAKVRQEGHSIEGEVTDEYAKVTGTRADNGNTITYTFTMDMARRIQARVKGGKIPLADKETWKNFPESMLWARAVSQLCRMLFSDCLSGATYTAEELEDSVGEPEAAEVRGGNPVAVSQPDLDGVEAASPTDTGTEGGGGSPSVDLNDPDIPFGDAPPDPPKPSAAQIKKLNVLVKAVGPESLAERFGPTLLNRVYATIADIRGWTTDELVNTIGGKDADGTLRWTPLRDALSKHEAHELIDRLERLEAK